MRILVGVLYAGAGGALVRGMFLVHPALGWIVTATCALAAAGWLARVMEVGPEVRVTPSSQDTPEVLAQKMARGAQVLNARGVRLHEPGRVDH